MFKLENLVATNGESYLEYRSYFYRKGIKRLVSDSITKNVRSLL